MKKTFEQLLKEKKALETEMERVKLENEVKALKKRAVKQSYWNSIIEYIKSDT